MPEFTLDHLDNSWLAPGGRQLVGQAAYLTFESACMAAIGRTFVHRHWYYYSTIRLILVYRPSEGGRLSRPRHTAVSVQPVPKAAYRSDFRENTNFCPQRDSNLGPLAQQASVLPLDHHCDLYSQASVFTITGNIGVTGQSISLSRLYRQAILYSL